MLVSLKKNIKSAVTAISSPTEQSNTNGSNGAYSYFLRS